jgi:Mg2+ and Co2+ transporter CorA
MEDQENSVLDSINLKHFLINQSALAYALFRFLNATAAEKKITKGFLEAYQKALVDQATDLKDVLAKMSEDPNIELTPEEIRDFNELSRSTAKYIDTVHKTSSLVQKTLDATKTQMNQANNDLKLRG